VMCCSFVIPFFTFGLRSIFQQSYPISTYEAGIGDVLLFCDFLSLCLVLRYFQQSYPISTYESRDWVMCCSLWFLSFVWS
jgi:hypothetical protein